MKKIHSQAILVTIALCLAFSSAFTQKDCPAIPVKLKFDTLGYISANIPTNASNASGKLWLGQGFVNWHGIELRPGFIPDNRPSWAIAIAVAWNYARNLAQRVEYPQMGYWMGTLIQESQLSCVTTTEWDDPTHSPVAWQLGVGPGDAAGTGGNGGCLQIEGPGSGYGVVQQSNPAGRFPNGLYSTLVQGDDGFEASALIKAYYDAYTSQIYHYNVPGDWDIYKNVDCNQAVDKFSYIKMSGSGYNTGHLGFANNQSVINTTSGCWGGLTGTTANYGNDVGSNASVFENETGYCEYPAGSSFHSYYDKAIPWSDVEQYLDLISKMYPEIDFAGKVVPEVQAKFIAGAGSITGTLNFSDFGNVIDAIVLCLPLEKPTPVEGSPGNISLKCPGNLLPYGHADILNGATNMCLGESVTLELMVDAGNGPDVTYKWFKGDAVSGTLIGTEKILTISPTAVGTQVYAGQICNTSGCYTIYSNSQNACQDPRNLNGFNVVARDCNTCGFVATASSTKSTCKGMTDGSIAINLTNAPANYTVDITANTTLGSTTTSSSGSSSTININNIRDGSYNIVLTSTTDPDCKAYTNVIVGFVTAINEYVKGELVSVNACVADVKATITKLPSPCNWRLVVHQPTYFAWTNWVNVGVKTSTGVYALAKDTRIAPKPELSDWDNVPVSEQSFSLNTGDVITFVTAVTTTPGATQLRDYTYNLYDENDVLVYTATSPAGSANSGPFEFGDYTVTCPTIAPDYTFSWDPTINSLVNTATTSTGKAAQADTDTKYVVTATNAANPQCKLIDTILVVGDPTCNPVVSCAKPAYEVLTPDTSICSGDTAQVRIAFTGTQPYALYFTPNGLPQVIVPNITNDFYTIPVNIAGAISIDSLIDNTCTNDTLKSLTITVADLPVLSLGNDTSVCGTGLTLSGGTFTTYEWQETLTNNTQTFTATTIGVNDYILKVTNASGCDAIDTINVTLNPSPTAIDVRDTSLCLADLPIILDAAQSDVTYLWNDASTGATLNATTAGDYWVIVTQAGCSDTDSVAITLKGAATVGLGNDTTICGTSLTLDALAGQMTYQWMEDITNNGQTFTANATGSNEYRVEVSNADGCISRDTINVTLNPKPVFNFSSSDTMFACSSSFPVNLDATTATATYLWNDVSSANNLNVNAQGDYWVIVTVNGCSDTDSVYVKESSILSLDLGINTTVCPGQPITLNPIVHYANISYTWSDGSSGTSLTTSTPGKIYLDIADAGGCAGTDTLELSNDNPLVINLGADPATLCFGDTANLELTPARIGMNYSWDDGTAQVSADSLHSVWAEGTATYTLTVDSAGCTFNDDVMITINALPTVSLGLDTFVCQGVGATITLDAGAGQANYQWNDGSGNQTLIVGGAGDYNVIVTDGNGCIAKDTLTVDQENATIITLTSDQTICPAGSGVVILDPTSVAANKATWTWTNDNSTNPAPTYTVQNKVHGDVVVVAIDYTNEFGCVTSATSTVTVSNVLAVNGLKDQSLCEGESFSGFTTDFTTAANRLDYTYVWHDGTTETNFPVNNVTMADSNTAINVTVTDNVLGCTGSASATLTVNPLPVPVLVNATTCLGIAVNIDSQLPGATHTFSWTKNGTLMAASNVAAQTIDGLTAGTDTYVVTVTVDATTCSVSATSVVTIVALPLIDLGSPTQVCEGTPVTIPVAGGGYSTATHDHVWSLNGAVLVGENENTFQASVDGTYSLAVTEIATTCEKNQIIALDFISKPNIKIVISDSVICEGTLALLEASELNNDYNYNWYFSTDPVFRGDEVTSATDKERISDANESGFYTLVVTPKQANCPDTGTVSLLVRELPVSGIQQDSIVCFEEMKDHLMVLDAAPLSGSRFAPSYSFLWSSGDTTQAIKIRTKGEYSVIITDDKGCVGEGEVLISEDCMPNVWVASGFTPNGDARNETWGIEGRGISSMEILVFNRWGEQIWKGTSISDKWDGTFGPNTVPQDVYVWVLKYSFFDVLNNEKTRSQTGTVAVVR